VRDHNHRSGLRSALYLPIFDALADPAVVARLAAEAEEAGFSQRCRRRSWRLCRWEAGSRLRVSVMAGAPAPTA